MEGPKGKGDNCLLTMVDRKLRKTLIFKLPSQTQESVIKVLDGMVRRVIPKGTLIAPISKENIINLETWINNYPRRLFKGKSSNQKELNFKKAQ